MKYIPLSQGKVATVCDCHYKLVAGLKWQVAHGYALHTIYAPKPTPRRNVLMHRVILGAAPGQLVDHKDQDKLNNQCSNLRLATTAQNNYNRGLSKNNSTGYKGVYWVPANKNWQARIRDGGKLKYLGAFPTARKAAIAWDAEARRLHGEFADLNFSGSRTQPLPE